MTSPITSLEQALTQRLAADAELKQLIPIDLMAMNEENQRLYTYIPEKAISPYINITGPVITKVYVLPEDVVDVRVTLHIWHNQNETGQYGNRVIARCLYAVKQALRYRLFPDGYEVKRVTIDDNRIFDDVNADVKHAVFALTYRLEKIKSN